MAGTWFTLDDCAANLPAALCRHHELLIVLIYLLPSALLAFVIVALSRLHPVFFLFRLAGTICHELAHFVVGLLTGARPASFSIIPHRSGRYWTLGVVRMNNVRWFNAAPAALAPLLILAIPLIVAWWRTSNGLHFDVTDGVIALLLAPQFLSFFPSWTDWKIAVLSWPYLPLITAVWWVIEKVLKVNT
ncbi:MAG TPA: M50 family metallopeptidase [Burkholderiaceae bacterium]|jgi:hypothetical protein